MPYRSAKRRARCRSRAATPASVIPGTSLAGVTMAGGAMAAAPRIPIRNESIRRTYRSGVASLEHDGGDDQQQRGPAGEHTQALPRAEQVVRALLRVQDELSGIGGHPGVDVVPPTVGQQPGQVRHDEDQPEYRRDRPGRVSQDRPERQREQPEYGDVEPGTEHRPGDAGIAEADRDVRGDDLPADEERGERQQLTDDEHQDREHRDLGGQYGQPARLRLERGPDHPGGVFGGNHHHAQYRDDELADEHRPDQDDLQRAEQQVRMYTRL